MDQTPQLCVYKASAGSGKTFTLAVEYITLLIKDPNSYQNILAVTFTNKATAEMKERILSQLLGIAYQLKESEPYLENIKQRTQLDDITIQENAKLALKYILHDYSHFRVETIDSFFQTVLRNLARELDLSPNLNIELDIETILNDAVDSMLEKLKANSQTMNWIINYIKEKISDNNHWNISREVKMFAKNITLEEYITKGKRLRELLKDSSFLFQFKKSLEELRKTALDEVVEMSHQFFQILDDNLLDVDDFAYRDKGVAGYFVKINQKDISNKIVTKRAEICMSDATKWVSKTSDMRDKITELAANQLVPLINEIEEVRKKNYIIVNTCELSSQHLNKIGLLVDVDTEMRDLNHDKNRFLLSDTNNLLHELIQDEDSSFVFEKIGSNIKNIMIDEFQDTSRMQWSNFKLLLLEGLSQGADSLIVGDVKQSIYRWRGGDWQILNQLQGALNYFPIVEKTLTINRRSESNIISFNNQFFEESVNFFNELHQKELGTDCEELIKAYADVKQESPKEVAKGYTKTTLFDIKDTEEYRNTTVKELGEEVQQLIKKGTKLEDIAIIIRKNKDIPLIADYFDKQLNIPIVSDEAFKLDASSAINTIINALKYLVNKSDDVAKANLIVNYQKMLFAQPKDLFSANDEFNINTFLMSEKMEDYLPKEFTEQFEQLALLPLYNLIERLCQIFKVSLLQNQDAYLFSFFDQVELYLQSNASDINHFVNYWDEKMHKLTIPGGELEGIRIMSIHKSKGLEFHTVLIPFCDWSLETEVNNQLVWCSPKYSPFQEIDLLPISYKDGMADSFYRDDYLNEKLQLWVDCLNMLYVAFTRAGKNLIIWSKKEGKKSVSNLLDTVLPNLREALDCSVLEEEDKVVYEYGELVTSDEKKEKKESQNIFLTHPKEESIQMESISPNFEFKQSNQSREYIHASESDEPHDSMIDRGQMLHKVFSEINTEKDISSAIERLYLNGIITSPEEKKQIEDIINKAFEDPTVKDWYSNEWDLYNECTIIYRENSRTITRRPDRVMVSPKETIVVDFKFGKPSNKYIKQVRDYMNLLISMNYKNVKGFLWYVEENEITPVHLK